jgi:hypothetical protein
MWSLFFPLRAWLGEYRQVTPELVEMALLCAASWSFERASEVLRRLTGVSLSSSEIHALCQEEGECAKAFAEESSEAVVAKAKADYSGRRDSRRVYTGFDGVWVGSRESKGGVEGKVGILFEEDPENLVEVSRKRQVILSKRYVGSFMGWRPMADQADREAWSRGWETARATVYGDGASWIGSVRDEVFPGSQLILDWWHLKEKLRRCLHAVVENKSERRRIQKVAQDHLWRGDWRAALAELSAHPHDTMQHREAMREITSYIRNQSGGIINYGSWRDAGRRVSASTVEKTGDLIVARRMKHQGMSWTRRGADRITALRICLLNQDWDAFQKTRKAA